MRTGDRISSDPTVRLFSRDPLSTPQHINARFYIRAIFFSFFSTFFFGSL
jgi:hypothetical protein